MPCSDTVDEAVCGRADLLLTHHPLLLRGVTTVAEDRYKGALSRVSSARTALSSPHTPTRTWWPTGTSATRLASRLGLVDVRPLVAGRIPRRGESVAWASWPTPDNARAARAAARGHPAADRGRDSRIRGLRRARLHRRTLRGRRGLPTELAGRVESDVYITSDLRHHPASEFRENARVGGGPALSTCHTGRASGSGSTPQPSSCAPRCRA